MYLGASRAFLVMSGASLTLASPAEVACLISFMFIHDAMILSAGLTVLVADAGVQVDLSIDILAVLTGNSASEDVAMVDADAGDLAGVVEVRHDELGEELI